MRIDTKCDYFCAIPCSFYLFQAILLVFFAFQCVFPVGKNIRYLDYV